MTRSLRAVYESGVLRPLEPLPLRERQEVTVTVSDHDEERAWVDTGFLTYLEAEADDSITIDEVRGSLAKVLGSMVQDFRAERDERI